MDARLATAPPHLAPLSSPLARGYALGLLGVVLFALTIPMTRLAGGTALAPELPPSFVALGRAAVAGVCSVAYLLAVRAAWPSRADWPWLALTCLGVVFGFPLLLGLAYSVSWVPGLQALTDEAPLDAILTDEGVVWGE